MAENDFAWFTAWVDQRLGVCLTFARGLTREQLVAGLGLTPPTLETTQVRTFDGADDDPDRPKVRIGEIDGWAYAVEHFTSRGGHPDTLSRLSAGRGGAFALVYTQTISAFSYAADGEYMCGVDLVVPHIRWGSDPHRFDSELERVRLLRPAPGERERAPALGARFVQLAFGVTVDREMLERPLASFDLA